MTAYLDPPLWPRHGRQWGHLVSDSSLTELHAVAAAAGLTHRAFDLDHYDVAAEQYPAVVDAGAVEVDSRELVRRLRGSGLRVTAAQRRTRAHRPA